MSRPGSTRPAMPTAAWPRAPFDERPVGRSSPSSPTCAKIGLAGCTHSHRSSVLTSHTKARHEVLLRADTENLLVRFDEQMEAEPSLNSSTPPIERAATGHLQAAPRHISNFYLVPLAPIDRTGTVDSRSQKGHLSTAPVAGAFFTCGLVRYGHVFGLSSTVHVTTRRDALRGSGPGQKLAFDDALALWVLPDRRIKRLSWSSPFPTFTCAPGCRCDLRWSRGASWFL